MQGLAGGGQYVGRWRRSRRGVYRRRDCFFLVRGVTLGWDKA